MNWVCSYGVTNCPQCKRDGVALKAERLAPNYTSAKRRPQRNLAAYDAAVPADQRVYLKVKYAEKNDVKALGARWDAARTAWYADARDQEMVASLERWSVTKTTTTKTKTKTTTTTQVETVETETKTTTTIEAPAGSFSFDELMSAIKYADDNVAPAAPAPIKVVQEVEVLLAKMGHA
jgi:hypothetical protein